MFAERIPTLGWIADRTGYICWYNQRWYEYGGVTQAEMEGWGWQSMHHPETLPKVLDLWTKCIASGEPFDMVFPLRGADGVFRPFLTRVVPHRDHTNTITHWFGTNTDISGQQAAEEALRLLNETLEMQVEERTRALHATEEALMQSQKMEAIGQLTGGIAHDFNNMLAIIIGSLDLAKRRLTSDHVQAGRFLDNALEGANRAAALTQRLLAFSRQQPLSPKTIEANKLVKNMSELLARTIGETIELETVLGAGLWRIKADPQQLESAILNLAVNARDAMPQGGKLTIETSNSSLDERYAAEHIGLAPGQYVMVAVSDSGAGMSQEVMDQAFNPFFTTKEAGKGTGLGLSQVYGFVKQSGGHVKIYSEAGVGTAVKVYLPRFIGKDSEIEAERRQPPILADRSVTVLVVEDEEGVRRLTCDAVRELGYHVIEAESASSALRLLEAHPEVRLLFTDVVMPHVNGRQLAQQARAMRPGLKVLFTTGYTRNAIVHNSVLDVGVEFLPKPFSLEQLGKKIQSVLDEE